MRKIVWKDTGCRLVEMEDLRAWYGTRNKGVEAPAVVIEDTFVAWSWPPGDKDKPRLEQFEITLQQNTPSYFRVRFTDDNFATMHVTFKAGQTNAQKKKTLAALIDLYVIKYGN